MNYFQKQVKIFIDQKKQQNHQKIAEIMKKKGFLAGHDKFFARGSPMGQPDTVNQLPDHARLLNPKVDVGEKLHVESYNTLSLGHTAYK